MLFYQDTVILKIEIQYKFYKNWLFIASCQ